MSEDKLEISQTDLDKLITEKVEAATLGLKAKNEELLGETKKYKTAAKQLEDDQKEKEQRLAQEQGRYKELFEQKETELEDLRANVAKERQRVADSEKNRAVQGIASSLTKDNVKQGVLARILQDNVIYDEGKVSYVLDNQQVERGSIVEYVQSNYAFAIDGNPARGDAATGTGAKPTKSLKEMSISERVALANSDPAAYEKLKGG